MIETPAPDFGQLVLGRRVVQTLADLAGLLGVAVPERIEDGIGEFVRAVADQAEIAALNDEHTLSDAVGRLDARFRDSGLDHDDVAGVIGHLRLEVCEIVRSIDDLSDATGASELMLRTAALTEIGDAMLLLARLAMRLGASPLEPLRLTILKSAVRLSMFESMGESRLTNPMGAWRMAKMMVMARK